MDEDKPLAGQKFVGVSFVSPENILNKKSIIILNTLKDFDMTKSVEKFTQFLNFVSYKYNLKFEQLTRLNEYLKSEADTFDSNYVKDFIKTNQMQMKKDFENSFNEECNFQTNTYGLKIRGCYATQRG